MGNLQTKLDLIGSAPSRSAARPLGDPQIPTHYAAVFRGGDDAYLQVVQLKDFDYSLNSLSGSFLDWLKLASTENHDIYDVEGPAGKSSVRRVCYEFQS